MTHNHDSNNSFFAGKSIIIPGRDYIKGSHNIGFSLMMIGVLTLGGAWGLGLRIKLNPQGIQIGGDIQPQQTQLTK